MAPKRAPQVPVAIGLLVVCLATVAMVPLPTSAAALTIPPWFSPNVIVNGLPAYSGLQPSLAVGATGTLYVAYGGWGGPTTQQDIFFSRSADGGRTWTDALRVNNDAGGASQSRPSLVLDSAENIYVLWTDTRGGTTDIYFSKSTNGGLAFPLNTRVNDITVNFQVNGDIAVDDTGLILIHAVWEDNRNALTTGPDIYYANSTDGGSSFNPSARVNNDAGAVEQARPSVAVASDRSVYVLWDDQRVGGRGRDIYFSKSTDLGGTWTANIFINDDSLGATQDTASVAVDEVGVIHVIWIDSRNAATAPDIYTTRSSNGGSTFTANAWVNDDGGATWQSSPSLSVNAGKVQAMWSDGRTIGSTGIDIYTASFDGVLWGENVRVNDDTIFANDQLSPSVAVGGGGDVFAAWTDERVSGQDVFSAVLDVHAPTAATPASATVPQGGQTSFDGFASTDNLGIATWEWDFGDGTGEVGSAVTHTYSVPGAYTATLTVRDRSGNADTASVAVTVLDTEVPTARGGGNRSVNEGQSVFFDAGASTDNIAVTSYEWDFGDGTNSTDAAVSHDYASVGTYDVTLTVWDAAGNANTVTMTVQVRAANQSLWAAIMILAILLVIVGFIAFENYRRSRLAKKVSRGSAPPPPGAQEMHPLPPPPPAPPAP